MSISFLVGTLSVHGDVKLASLWSDSQVFHQYKVDGRLESGLFLNIPTNFLSSEGDGFGLLPDLGKEVRHENNL